MQLGDEDGKLNFVVSKMSGKDEKRDSSKKKKAGKSYGNHCESASQGLLCTT